MSLWGWKKKRKNILKVFYKCFKVFENILLALFAQAVVSLAASVRISKCYYIKQGSDPAYK